MAYRRSIVRGDRSPSTSRIILAGIFRLLRWLAVPTLGLALAGWCVATFASLYSATSLNPEQSLVAQALSLPSKIGPGDPRAYAVRDVEAVSPSSAGAKPKAERVALADKPLPEPARPAARPTPQDPFAGITAKVSRDKVHAAFASLGVKIAEPVDAQKIVVAALAEESAPAPAATSTDQDRFASVAAKISRDKVACRLRQSRHDNHCRARRRAGNGRCGTRRRGCRRGHRARTAACRPLRRDIARTPLSRRSIRRFRSQFPSTAARKWSWPTRWRRRRLRKPRGAASPASSPRSRRSREPVQVAMVPLPEPAAKPVRRQKIERTGDRGPRLRQARSAGRSEALQQAVQAPAQRRGGLRHRRRHGLHARRQQARGAFGHRQDGRQPEIRARQDERPDAAPHLQADDARIPLPWRRGDPHDAGDAATDAWPRRLPHPHLPAAQPPAGIAWLRRLQQLPAASSRPSSRARSSSSSWCRA